MQSHDISIDCETMGTDPGSIVVSVGACFFDTNTGEIDDGFYRVIHMADSQRHGLVFDAATVLWWLGQPDPVRNAIRFGGEPLCDVMDALGGYIKTQSTVNDVRPWLRGPSFDGSLLTAAYSAAKVPTPWKYWNERCHRTITARNPGIKEPERQGDYHNALDDAKHQARWLINIAEAHRARIKN